MLETIFQTLLLPVALGVPIYFLSVAHFKKERGKLLVSPGISASKWRMVGGKETNVFYDLDKACSDPQRMKDLDNWFVDNVKELNSQLGVDSIAFIEREDGPIGAITKKDLVSSLTGIPSFLVRPRRRALASVIKGTKSVARQKVIIVTDVTSTGHSVSKVIDLLEQRQAKVVGVVAVVNRGGKQTAELFQKKSISFRFAEDNLASYKPTCGQSGSA